MEKLGEEVIEAVKEVKLSELNQWQVDHAIKRVEPEVKGGFGTLLFWVSIVELVAYIVFFLWKRRKTRGFKKAD
jgi:mannose-binding lectin 1